MMRRVLILGALAALLAQACASQTPQQQPTTFDSRAAAFKKASRPCDPDSFQSFEPYTYCEPRVLESR